MDYKKWTDVYIPEKFLDADGYLTESAHQLMEEFEVYTLEDLLKVVEGKGKGWWYKSDVSRSDVNSGGHQVFSDKYGADAEAMVNYTPKSYNNEDSYNDYK